MAEHTVGMLFSEGLEYLYGAHRQGGSQAAANQRTSTSPRLRAMLRTGARTNGDQARRLEQVFRSAGLKPRARHSKAMQGIIDANNAAVARTRDPAARDLLNIEMGQIAAHFYLAAYGTLRTQAEHLGLGQAVRLLQQTLDETGQVDQAFTRLAGHLTRRSASDRYGDESAFLSAVAMHPGMTTAAVMGLFAAGVALLGRSEAIKQAPPRRPARVDGPPVPGPVDEAAVAGLSL